MYVSNYCKFFEPQHWVVFALKLKIKTATTSYWIKTPHFSPSQTSNILPAPGPFTVQNFFLPLHHSVLFLHSPFFPRLPISHPDTQNLLSFIPTCPLSHFSSGVLIITHHSKHPTYSLHFEDERSLPKDGEKQLSRNVRWKKKIITRRLVFSGAGGGGYRTMKVRG